jgi:hypothetical protein
LPRDNDASPEHSPRRILVVELLLDWCAVTLAEPHHGLSFIRLGQIRDSDALEVQPATYIGVYGILRGDPAETA